MNQNQKNVASAVLWILIGVVGLSMLVFVLETIAPTKPKQADPVAVVAAQVKTTHYTTTKELVPNIVLTTGQPYRYVGVYKLDMPLLKAGDVVAINSQFEGTNDLGYNVMVAHAIVVADTASPVLAPKPQGIIVSEYAGENIVPAEHHGFRTICGSFAVPKDGDYFATLYVYAASTAATPGARLTINQGYGHLSAIVHRN